MSKANMQLKIVPLALPNDDGEWIEVLVPERIIRALQDRQPPYRWNDIEALLRRYVPRDYGMVNYEFIRRNDHALAQKA